MTEPTRGKGAKGPSWLADLTKLQEVGDAHTFRPPDTVFDYSTAERGSGATGRVVVRASVSKDKAQAKGLLVHIPHALAEKLAAEVSGPTSVALCGLAEWALEQLTQRREILTIQNRKIEQ
jgi:hypothetical protein